MSRIIIGVPGLGNKPAARLLEFWWKKSICEGLQRIGRPRQQIPFKLVYWSDILHEKPLRLSVKDREHPLYLAERYRASDNLPRPESKNLKRKILKYLEEQLDTIFLNEDMSLNFAGVSDRIIRHYFKDLDAYYSSQTKSLVDPSRPACEMIRERLVQVLREHKDDEILLIGHSMGSIICFDVLNTMADEVQVDTLLTLGSPLGLPVIVSKIYTEQQNKPKHKNRLQTPENVRNHWYNLSDVEDKIALDHTLADDYQANSCHVRAVDVYVYNDYHNGEGYNPHKIYGYLRTRECAHIIDKFLGIERLSLARRLVDNLRQWLRESYFKISRALSLR